METLLELAQSANPEKLREALKAMTWLAIVQKGSQELPKALQILKIDHPDLEISGRSLQLLQQLLPDCAEAGVHLLPLIVHKLGSSHAIISRTAFNCIALAGKAVPEAVMKALTDGLTSKSAKVKSQCLRSMSLHSDFVTPAIVEQIVALLPDKTIGTVALQTAKQLLKASETLKESVSTEVLDKIEKGLKPVGAALSPRKGEGLRVLEPELATEILDSPNWRDKVEALEEIKENLSSKAVQAQVSHVLKFLLALLGDGSVRIVNGTLQLIEELLKCKGIVKRIEWQVLTRELLTKLGEERISYRQSAFKILRTLLQELRPSLLFPSFLQGLKSENWHLREGCLTVIMAALLEKNPNYVYDYSTLIAPINPLLTDSKAKIRFVAIETLAVVASVVGPKTVLQHLIADEVLTERIKARLRKKQLALLREDWVELPKIAPGSAPLMQSTQATESGFKFTDLTPPKRVIRKAPRPFQPDPLETSAPVKVMRATYIKTEELEPVNNPELELHRLVNWNPQQWADQFELMNSLRKLLKHNKEVFLSVPLQALIFQILRWADSLRSALAKNALIVIGEIGEQMNKVFEPDLEQVLGVLLRKSTDTNVFISAEAEKSLLIVCVCSNEKRVVTFLIQSVQSTRSPLIKAKAALCVCKLLEKKQEAIRRLKEFDACLQLLASLSKDGSAEVRKNSKAALVTLNTSL